MRSFLFAAAALGVGALASSASADLAFAVTLQGTLVSFNTNTPGILLSGSAIQGLASNEVIRGIDFRPATGQLYGLGSFGNLYTLNTLTGAASLVGNAGPLSGSSFGFDFNPTVDRIRVVSDTNQNMRLNPDTGAVAGADAALNYALGGGDPNVIHAAYTNNFAGAQVTTLYVIDEATHALYTQNPPNNGTLNLVGPLGETDFNDLGGFDIGSDNQAWAIMQPQFSSFGLLYSINLNTGAATPIGQIGGGAIITAFAVQIVPAPGAAALGLLGLGALSRRRSR